jgi:1-acyl-sn-glycerol-3-phosphate acyltransferase
MNRTVFDTPVLRIVFGRLSRLALALAGWKVEGRLPDVQKFVLVGAPHTSNWDLPFTLLIAFALGADIRWMGKDTLFREPLGWIFEWLGGIPIDRSKPHNVVAQSIQQFLRRERLILTIAPAGTRRNVRQWKTGFYHIARGAGVPIALGFLDYRRKAGGMGPLLWPTGDLDADMKTIAAFYETVSGKHPERPPAP